MTCQPDRTVFLRLLTALPALALIATSPAQDCLQLETSPNPVAGAGLGAAVAMDDLHAIAGAPDVEEVVVWTRVGNAWTLLQVLNPNGDPQASLLGFGSSLDVENGLIAVGCVGSEQVQLFVRNPATSLFEYRQTIVPNDLTAGDTFGQDVTVEGGHVLVSSMREDSGASNAGAVYVFEPSGPTWVQTNKLIAPDAGPGDFFGVAIDSYDDVLVIGALYDDDLGFDSGSAYVYRRNPQGLWGFETKLHAPDGASRDYFGVSVATNANSGIIIGCEGDDDQGEFSGSAHIFRESGTGWYHHAKLLGWDGGTNDDFGFAVACSGDYYDISARGHNGATGAVYRFCVFQPGNVVEIVKFGPSAITPGETFGSALDMNTGGIYSGIIGAEGYSPSASANVAGAVYLPFYGTAGYQDCNANFIDDYCELVSGSATDGNGNNLLDECEAIGTLYCTPNANHSGGTGGKLLAIGSTTAGQNDLTLTAFDLPQNRFGYFIAGKQIGLIPFPGGSQGILCLTGTVGRFNQPGEIGNTGASGSYSFTVDLTNIPFTPPVAVQAGETWYFQSWFRDLNPGPTSNFTEAVTITYQ